MTIKDPRAWLDQWAEQHFSASHPAGEKADMREEARQCVEVAVAQGFTIDQIKQASGGDLETYLLEYAYDRGAFEGRTGP